MPCRALDWVRCRAAAVSLAAGLLSVTGTGASVEVRGSIQGQSDAGPLEVSLVPALTLYELLSTVLRDEPDGFRAAEATVPVSDGAQDLSARGTGDAHPSSAA